jgi:hypothetical protein
MEKFPFSVEISIAIQESVAPQNIVLSGVRNTKLNKLLFEDIALN